MTLERNSLTVSHRPSPSLAVSPLLPLLVSVVFACSPEPRWVAVASADADVRLFDGDLRPVAIWRLGARPAALGSSGDGLGILVALHDDIEGETITWLRRTDGATVIRQALPGRVHGLWVDRPGRRVVALTDGATGSVTMLDADRLTLTQSVPACPQPIGLVFAPDGDRAYVTCRPGALVEVDLELGMVVRSASLGADSGRACGAGRGDISGNGTLLFVPCAATGRLLYLDRATLRPWDSVEVGAGVTVAATTPEAVAIALLPDRDRVALVNLRTKALLATVSITNPVDLAVGADGRIAFVAGTGRGPAPATLLKLDSRSGTDLGRVVLPAGARAVEVWPGRRESRMFWGAGF